ncbi:hypothetical protein GCM10020218_101080 [Dactylosporangium vinaceum]
MNEFSSAEFDDFVRTYRARVLADLLMFCGNQQNAEDAAQEAFVAAYRDEAWRSLTHPRAWLRKVAVRSHRAATEKWWHRWHQPAWQLADLPAPAGVDDEAAAVLVLRTVGVLPLRQRQVLIMHCLWEMPYTAIAAELGISVNTVGVNLNKARARLRDLLGLGITTGNRDDALVAVRALGAGAPPEPVLAELVVADAWLAAAVEQDTETLERLRAGVLAIVELR